MAEESQSGPRIVLAFQNYTPPLPNEKLKLEKGQEKDPATEVNS